MAIEYFRASTNYFKCYFFCGVYCFSGTNWKAHLCILHLQKSFSQLEFCSCCLLLLGRLWCYVFKKFRNPYCLMRVPVLVHLVPGVCKIDFDGPLCFLVPGTSRVPGKLRLFCWTKELDTFIPCLFKQNDCNLQVPGYRCLLNSSAVWLQC